MDQITEDGVRRIVEVLIEDESMFSLHDVTTLARREGLTVKHYGHGGVREYVNGLLQSPMFDDYEITSNGEFNIFHPLTKNANEYDKDEHRSASPAAAPTGTVSLSPPVPAFVAPVVDDGKIDTDSRGRLCVRAALLRKLGANPGDTVYVGLGVHEISRHFTVGDLGLVIDKDNCLRLSNRVLSKMFGHPTPCRYELELNTVGTILIK